MKDVNLLHSSGKGNVSVSSIEKSLRLGITASEGEHGFFFFPPVYRNIFIFYSFCLKEKGKDDNKKEKKKKGKENS